ncbi:MAG: 50S ribosomal protein L9 [Elusimicrobia bacterium]|nr:50S ribosomal protein L9 [Elusimicrobiota bacterium]
MKVILKSDVEKLGNQGEVKDVRPGFARNYLIPNKLAHLATPAALKTWEKGEAKRKAQKDQDMQTLRTLAEKLRAVSLSFSRPLGEQGKLFGSVGKSDIAKSLKAAGYEVPKESVVLGSTLRTVGDFEVELKLGHGISSKIKVVVSARS